MDSFQNDSSVESPFDAGTALKPALAEPVTVIQRRHYTHVRHDPRPDTDQTPRI